MKCFWSLLQICTHHKKKITWKISFPYFGPLPLCCTSLSSSREGTTHKHMHRLHCLFSAGQSRGLRQQIRQPDQPAPPHCRAFLQVHHVHRYWIHHCVHRPPSVQAHWHWEADLLHWSLSGLDSFFFFLLVLHLILTLIPICIIIPVPILLEGKAAYCLVFSIHR